VDEAASPGDKKYLGVHGPWAKVHKRLAAKRAEGSNLSISLPLDTGDLIGYYVDEPPSTIDSGRRNSSVLFKSSYFMDKGQWSRSSLS
jgi:hypothetical protein